MILTLFRGILYTTLVLGLLFRNVDWLIALCFAVVFASCEVIYFSLRMGRQGILAIANKVKDNHSPFGMGGGSGGGFHTSGLQFSSQPLNEEEKELLAEVKNGDASSARELMRLRAKGGDLDLATVPDEIVVQMAKALIAAIENFSPEEKDNDDIFGEDIIFDEK